MLKNTLTESLKDLRKKSLMLNYSLKSQRRKESLNSTTLPDGYLTLLS